MVPAWRRQPSFLDGWPDGQAPPHVGTRSSLGGATVQVNSSASYHHDDANRRAPGGGNHKISPLPQATEYQENLKPQEEEGRATYY
jgi:hypothetical protein